jgi:hypothetical protein
MDRLRSLPGGAAGDRPPRLPAFCRSRPPTNTVRVSSLRGLYRLLLVTSNLGPGS